MSTAKNAVRARSKSPGPGKDVTARGLIELARKLRPQQRKLFVALLNSIQPNIGTLVAQAAKEIHS